MRLSYYKYNLVTGIRRVKTKTALALTALSLAVSGAGGLSVALLGTAHAGPTSTVVYDSLASVSPHTNYPSQPFQAQQTNEFGDSVHLAGTARQLNTVTLTMSDWAKQLTPANVAWCAANAANCDATGFNWPITVNVYANTLDANDVPTTKLGTKTVTVHVPWRPESDPVCAPTNNGTGWSENGACFNYSGIAFNANFDLASLNLTLPNDVIVGFVYNTQSYGPRPTGVDGPYNSLNIAVPNNDPVTVGTDNSPNEVFWNTSTKSYYTNPNCAGSTFCRDTNWAPNGTVAMQITALSSSAPSSDACKNNGWQTMTDASGKKFKNQGDCVSYFATNGKNTASGPKKGTSSATGNVVLSGPPQTLAFSTNDNGTSALDQGSVTYSNPSANVTYTAPVTCVNVSGNTAYFAYVIPSGNPASGTWVVWKVVDNGTTDTAGFTTAADQASANALCEAGSASVTNYAITAGDIKVQ